MKKQIKQKKCKLEEISSADEIKKLNLEQVGTPVSRTTGINSDYDKNLRMHAKYVANQNEQYKEVTHFMATRGQENKPVTNVSYAFVFYKPIEKKKPQ